jgi:tRNA threonylcarbamoyladenosine biosynthesis protein TsaB
VRILAFDTATELCSAALWIDGECRSREDARPRGSGELILGMIDSLLAEAGLALRGLDAIAFGRGPGGFTGVRLSVAIAQGLGFAASVPLLPVSDLRAIAQQALARADAPAHALICQDARMGQVYWACYSAPLAQPRSAERLDAPGEVRVPTEWVRAALAACGAGSGFGAYPTLGSTAGALLAPVLPGLRPRALEMAALAAAEGMAGAVQPEDAQPVYLRDEVAALPSRN